MTGPIPVMYRPGVLRIAATLRAKGLPIPSNDIWIAAHTMETGADLVSYDRHFDHIDGLAWTLLAVEP